MRINRIALKKSADQHDLGREQMQPRRHCFGVLAQNARPFFEDFHDVPIPFAGRFEHNRGEQRDLHFVRRLRPAHELIQVVQGKGLQDFGGERHFAPVQIILPQNQTQRLNDEKISAARIAQDMAPAARLLQARATPARHG